MARTAGSSTPRRPALGVLAGAVAMFLAVGCGEPTGPGDRVIRELAWLDFGYPDTLQVAVPESVERGASFEVTFMTYGGGCTAPNEVEVETTVRGLVAEIVPYQFRLVPRPGAGCPDRMWFKEREVTLQFERTGQAAILLRGRRELPLSAGGDTIELVIPYKVDVVEGR